MTRFDYYLILASILLLAYGCVTMAKSYMQVLKSMAAKKSLTITVLGPDRGYEVKLPNGAT